MNDMPRPRPPHLHRQVTRHGKTVWYIRIGKGRRIRIKAAIGTAEFDAEYHAAITIRLRPSFKGGASAGTLAWLIERYRETPAWLDLSLATRQQREAIQRMSSNRPATNFTRRSRAPRSSPAEIGGTQRRPRRGISLKRCADFFDGPSMRAS